MNKDVLNKLILDLTGVSPNNDQHIQILLKEYLTKHNAQGLVVDPEDILTTLEICDQFSDKDILDCTVYDLFEETKLRSKKIKFSYKDVLVHEDLVVFGTTICEIHDTLSFAIEKNQMIFADTLKDRLSIKIENGAYLVNAPQEFTNKCSFYNIKSTEELFNNITNCEDLIGSDYKDWSIPKGKVSLPGFFTIQEIERILINYNFNPKA